MEMGNSAYLTPLEDNDQGPWLSVSSSLCLYFWSKVVCLKTHMFPHYTQVFYSHLVRPNLWCNSAEALDLSQAALEFDHSLNQSAAL